MFRLSGVIILGLTGIGAAFAGSIDIPVDLTQVSGTLTCSTAQTGCSTSGTAFNSGAPFVNTLYSSILGTSGPTTGPVPQYFTNPGLSTVPFVLDGTSGGSGNATYVSGNSNNLTTTLVMDMGTYNGSPSSYSQGISNVDQLWTLIEASGEAFGFQGITITLNGENATGTAAITDTINFTAGKDYRTTSDVTGVTCTDANALGGSSATSCSGASSNTAQSSGSETQGNITVTTYNAAYTHYQSPSNYWLDVQNIVLPGIGQTGSFLGGGYLDTITITNISPSGGKERMVFSGLTVESATPEPGTILLLGTGLSALVFARLRRRR